MVFATGILLLIVGAFAGSLMVTALSFMVSSRLVPASRLMLTPLLQYYNGTIDNALPLTFNASIGVRLL